MDASASADGPASSEDSFDTVRCKRQKRATDSADTEFSLIQPHLKLIVPFPKLSDQEIRILTLKPGNKGSPLEAAIDVVKLRAEDGVSAQQVQHKNSDDDNDGRSEFGEPNFNHTTQSNGDQPVKYVKVGNSMHIVSLDYSGSGEEFIDEPDVHGDGSLSIDTANSEDNLDYEAVSYVWGEPIYSNTIEIDGHGVLFITQSLHGALERFRSTTTTRRLWADAICINQADNAERSAQVAVMARIYQQAKAVLVWLGPALESDALAFATMSMLLDDENMDHLVTVYEYVEGRLRQNSACRCCCEHFEGFQNVMAEALLAVGRVLHRAWFSRLWVVQEVSTSSQLRGRVTVFSGSHHISYGDLADVAGMVSFDAMPVGLLQEFSKFPSPLDKQLRDMWSGPDPTSDWYSDIGDWPPNYMLRVLVGMSVRNCSNPLDRVYAVRSLLNLEDAPSLLPDYSLTATEVYRNLLVVLFEIFQRQSQSDNDQPWALLALAGTDIRETVEQNMPSWVPNFNALTPRSRNKIAQYTHMEWLEVPQFLPAPLLFETRFDGPDILRIRGKCFAVIREILPDTEHPVFSETYSGRVSEVDLIRFREWYSRCLKAMKISPEKDEEVIAHSTTFLSCGCQLAKLPREMEDIEDAIDHSDGWLFPERWPQDPNLVREHFMLLCASESSPPDKSRRIARMDVGGKKDFCWAPPQARPGDQVCVVAGSSFPFVVREMPQGGFTLLGDAYLANTTLKQALTGDGKSRFEEDIYEDMGHPLTDDWNADDELMQRHVADMEWLTFW